MFYFFKVVLVVVSAFLWGFVVWRRLRSEYEPEKILHLISAFWTGWFVVGGLSWLLLHRSIGITEWGGVLGGLWLVRRVVVNYDWDWWEWLDILVLVSFGFAVFWYPLVLWSLLGLVMGGVALVGWIFLLWVASHYRSFGWYKSGKMGLIGILGVALWAIVQIVVAPIRPSELYWFGISVSQVVCGFVLSATIVNLYFRSGGKLKLTYERKPTTR